MCLEVLTIFCQDGDSRRLRNLGQYCNFVYVIRVFQISLWLFTQVLLCRGPCYSYIHDWKIGLKTIQSRAESRLSQIMAHVLISADIDVSIAR